jgi:hypothetical protein
MKFSTLKFFLKEENNIILKTTCMNLTIGQGENLVKMTKNSLSTSSIREASERYRKTCTNQQSTIVGKNVFFRRPPGLINEQKLVQLRYT